METARKTVPITRRALVQRLQRRLEAEGLELWKARGVAAGDWRVVSGGSVMATYATTAALFKYARARGAVRAWEELAS